MGLGQIIALIKALGGGSGGLPPVTASDNGKVLAVNDGVLGATYLHGNGRCINVEATYSNGEYSTDTQIDSKELISALLAGYDFRLVVGGNSSRMHLIASDGDTYAVFRASLVNGATVDVMFDGFDQKYLTISIYPYDNRFIVTLTPTAADFSGTMDKTPQEISAAYNAGNEIVFEIPSLSARVDADQYIASEDNVQFGAKVFYSVAETPVLITILTSGVDDQQTYATNIYALTPAT